MSQTDNIRININVKKEKLDEIKKLMEAAGVNSQKELFDNALTLAKWKKSWKSCWCY